MKLFGYQINKVKIQDNIESFTPISTDDGAVQIGSGAYGAWGTYVDLDGSVRSEAELVNKYRQMSEHPEVENACDDICNEAIVSEDDDTIVDIVLDDCGLSPEVEKIVRDEFNIALDLMEFNTHAYEIFKRWYVDGRLYYHAIIDRKHISNGIQELRYIDPRKIRKIRETVQSKDERTKSDLYKEYTEYYLYNDKGFLNTNQVGQGQSANFGLTGVKISPDAIVHCTSGLMSPKGDLVLSYMHKAIKPLNNLRSLEDASIIYRISRAPERRIFYVDVGNLPKMKAEQYMRDVMTRFKNRVVYNSETGEISSTRKFMTMLEDFWLPRRQGVGGTEISTLPGSQLTGILDEIRYFEEKLLKSLYVPISRMSTDNLFSSGRIGEVTRDEVKFAKFIKRLRMKFSVIFIEIIKRNLILKGLMRDDEFEMFEHKIRFNFHRDNYFEELKEHQILQDRLNLLGGIDQFVGKYFSMNYVKRKILMMDEDEIIEVQQEIDDEINAGLIVPLEAQVQSQEMQMFPAPESQAGTTNSTSIKKKPEEKEPKKDKSSENKE